MAAVQSVDDQVFFRYTYGRWLWDEQARLQERYRYFSVPGLQKIAAASVGAQHCVSMVKLAEGGFNKIFRLVMNDGSVVIARIPYPNAGSLWHTIASEVATMDFASTILAIPVSKILDWDAKTENAALTEYILMEEAAGTPLSSKWNSSDVDTKSEIVDELVSIAKMLLSVSFSRYGNLYFLVGYRGELMFQLPPHYQSLEEGEEKRKICSTVEKSLLLLSYESQMQHGDPALGRVAQLPQGQTIKDTVLFAANTWDGGLIPFRERLVRIQRNWGEICPGRKCPFACTKDELSAHVHEGEDWNQDADFWSSIPEIVGRDGFVMNADYDTALEMFRMLRETDLQELDGDERANFEIATIWAAK